MQHEIPVDDKDHLSLPMARAIETCVHCGFCLPACPTYRLLGQEMDSPRGRIVLMKEVLEGELAIEQAAPHIDACLGCLACEPACPSGVAYRDLISPFRATTDRLRKRSIGEKARQLIIGRTLPYPGRLRKAVRLGRLAKSFAKWFPSSWRPMLNLIPEKISQTQRFPESIPARGRRR